MKFAATLALSLLATSSVFAFDQAAAEARVKADLAKAIEGSAAIMQALKDQNAKHAGLTQADIDTMDKAWRAEAKGDSKPTINAMLETAASKELDALRDGSGGFYTEIFVMDNKGLNVAMSDATSDMWQADEDKFIRTYNVGEDGFFMDEVNFDESTKSFSVQMSATVKDPETKKKIGAVTFGIKAQ